MSRHEKNQHENLRRQEQFGLIHGVDPEQEQAFLHVVDQVRDIVPCHEDVLLKKPG
jgi:hypothetical protein